MFVEYMILRCKVKNRRGKRERRTKGEDARGEALKSRSEPPLPGEQVPGMVIHRVFTELKTLSSTDRERSFVSSLFTDAVVAVALYRHMIRIENLNPNPHEASNFEIQQRKLARLQRLPGYNIVIQR